MTRKILYLEGRPNAHILHKRLAESLHCVIEYIDAGKRWQDLGKSFFYNVYSWFVNAKFLASRYNNYDIFLVDNLHFTPIIMNAFFLRQRKKLVVHLGSHTLYFMYTKRFKSFNLWLHKRALERYDALICEGKMAEDLAQRMLGNKLPRTYTTFLGPPSERVKTLNELQPSLESPNILVIANGPVDFRLYYKGLDIMIKSFAIAFSKMPQLKLTILGHWTKEIIKSMLESVPAASENISFAGNVKDIESYLMQASLYLHCTRGDAFPTSTIEAMTGGVPVILSEWTGTREVIEQVDRKLIVALDENEIANRILWYFNLTDWEKRSLATRCREVAKNYTEETAVNHYRETFNQLFKDLNVEQHNTFCVDHDE